MGFIIRRTLPEDAYECTACRIASWRAAYRGIIPDEYLDSLSIEERAEKLKEYLNNEPKDHEGHCVIYENEIIGILSIGKCRDEDKPDAGEIEAIYFLEKFWGKGCGIELIDFAIDRLKSMGYTEIIIWVLEENNRARKFYEKRGFAFDGTKKEIIIGKPLIEIRYVLNPAV